MSDNITANTQCVFTIVASNYLPYARTLMHSVKLHTPKAKRIVFLCDRQTPEYDSTQDEFDLIPIEQIEIAGFPRMALAYSLIELCTAVKPFCFRHLFDTNYEEVIYLDPDIRTYAPLDEVFELLEPNNVVVTPHLTEPVSDTSRPNEIDILRAGTYNLGFIAVNASPEGNRFINWWAHRLRHQCLDEPNNGLYVDQRWIDLVPGMFDGVHISRNPGLNIAYWNLMHRDITRSGNTLSCNGEPLIFIHYSGINLETAEFSRHQNRYSLNGLTDVIKDETINYLKELRSNGANKRQPIYTYEVFHNGERISGAVRRAFRESRDTFELSAVCVDDPELLPRLAELLNTPMTHPISGAPYPQITLGLYFVYKSRPDLTDRFPDIFSNDTRAFVQWYLVAHKSNAILPEACVLYLQRGLENLSSVSNDTLSATMHAYHNVPILRRLVLKLTTEKSRKRLLSWLKKTNDH